MHKGFWTVMVPVVGIGLSVAAPSASAGTLISDDFEYLDQAAFQSAWPIATNSTISGTLSTAQAKSGTKSVNFGLAADQRNEQFFTATPHTAENPIVWQFDFFDSNGSAFNYRQWSELMSGAGSASGQLIAMGLNNAPESSHYMARVLGFDGGNGVSGFFKLDGAGAPTRSTGWHELKAVLTPTNIEFYVDDTLSKTVAWSGAGAGRSYDRVRLGSDLSATQEAFFDNVMITNDAVPEPSAIALAAVGATALLRRRRAAR